MMRRLLPTLLLLGVACNRKPSPPGPTPSAVASAAVSPNAGVPAFSPSHLAPFQPIPPAVEKPVLDDATRLGQQLFWDARLSKGQDVSCNGCHALAAGGMDGQVLSTATKGEKTKRNAPTVLNAGGSFAQGWDAKASTIEDFLPGHFTDVFAQDPAATVASIPDYAAAFRKTYAGEALSGELLARALGAFTKKLFARGRWDRYLEGDAAALSAEELGGLAMFVEAGCPTCHQGKYLGAKEAQKVGIAKEWPGISPTAMFKIPSLRNTWRTGPWLHDGSIATLEDVTRKMARHQVGKELSAVQAVAITSFLATLDGEPPKELAAKPALPVSGPKTPKPE